MNGVEKERPCDYDPENSSCVNVDGTLVGEPTIGDCIICHIIEIGQ